MTPFVHQTDENALTQLIALENTQNYCGGRVLPQGYIEQVGQLARRMGIPLHIDGARIWNAATALGCDVLDLGIEATSLSVCLSKGLGAPAGSVLIGPADFIHRARRTRKALGKTAGLTSVQY
jgi:threonine aldolase